MDEKLGIRFRKMQNYSYFAFLFEKGSEKFIKCRLRQNLNLYTFRRLRYWFSIFVAIKTIFTHQPNLEIS